MSKKVIFITWNLVVRFTARLFDRNMFIMLLAIMIGAIFITYFAADIIRRTEVESLESQIFDKDVEIEDIKEMNINFTNSFLQSSVLLDTAREDRAFGNYYYDLAQLFYTTALRQVVIDSLELYKNKSIDNCTSALPNFLNSHLNFDVASSFFNGTKKYTEYDGYIDLLNLYVKLTNSGSRLTLLRYNATLYLKYLAENLTLTDDGVGYLENMTGILDLFNSTVLLYGMELGFFEGVQEEIKEYDIAGFSPYREPN